MKRFSILLLSGLACLAAPVTGAAESGHASHASPYAGQDTRAIKSLSAQDVDDLLNGRGWGLAKAAELNGMPGPTHVLDMRDEIALTADQAGRIETIRRRMRDDAVRAGERLVALETALDRAFASGDISAESLKARLDEIETVRAELRYVHLAAHLEMPQILSETQVRTYNRLRGYASNDPCTDPPPGHDPDMWRRHNGCE